MPKPCILLSFDVEEFDLPLEYGQAIDDAAQLQMGHRGLAALNSVMNAFSNVRATYFTTAHFAETFPDEIKRLAIRNEIASHTYYHTRFEVGDLKASRETLERICGASVTGLRMPRMRPVEMRDVSDAGYIYDSSINPCRIPGRYDNRHLPRNPYMEEDVLRFPASVTPRLRIPLFWLAFKNAPYPLYRRWLLATLKRDGYACLYFHPWEFTRLDGYNVPGYAKRLAGVPLQNRLKKLIQDFKECDFLPMQDYITRTSLQTQ